MVDIGTYVWNLCISNGISFLFLLMELHSWWGLYVEKVLLSTIVRIAQSPLTLHYYSPFHPGAFLQKIWWRIGQLGIIFFNLGTRYLMLILITYLGIRYLFLMLCLNFSLSYQSPACYIQKSISWMDDKT